jgi:hypothetical protein
MDSNLKTGEVHAYGAGLIYPDAYEGTWEGNFSTHVSADGVVRGRAVVHGTGELEGMINFNSVLSPDFPDPDCNMMNTASEGYIIIP